MDKEFDGGGVFDLEEDMGDADDIDVVVEPGGEIHGVFGEGDDGDPGGLGVPGFSGYPGGKERKVFDYILTSVWRRNEGLFKDGGGHWMDVSMYR